MKAKRIFAGLAATVIAASLAAMSASALTLDEDMHGKKATNDAGEEYPAWYNVGGQGFYQIMPEWGWNAPTGWMSITEEGVFDVEFNISKVVADPKMDGTGALGCFGFQVCNLTPETTYEVSISNAKFVAEDGTEYVLDTFNNMTQVTSTDEGQVWFRCDPADTDEQEDGSFKNPALPELADTGWRESGFEGGTFTIRVDFGPHTPEDESSSEGGESGSSSGSGTDSNSSGTSSTSSTTSSSTSSSGGSTTTTSKSTTTTTTTTTSTSDATADNTATGAAAGAALALMAVGAAGVVISKKNR